MTVKPDKLLTASELKDFLRQFSRQHSGRFRVTLVKNNGQGYNLVAHAGGSKPKIRIGLVEHKGATSAHGSSTFDVADIVEKLFGDSGRFHSVTKETVENTLRASYGSVMLVVERGRVVTAEFHNGELWP